MQHLSRDLERAERTETPQRVQARIRPVG
jgi:hypothetical protein